MDRGAFTATGWTPPPQLSDTGWLETGDVILTLERATPWMWADWWLARDRRALPDDWAGPDQHTLDNYAVVARAFPFPDRREKVSFGHHAVLTSLPSKEREEWLDWCEQPHRPSISDLRNERSHRQIAAQTTRVEPEQPPPWSPSPPAPPEILPPLSLPPPAEITNMVHLSLPADLYGRAHEAAIKADKSLARWIVDLIAARLPAPSSRH
jgi:hypothetical protein